VDVSVDLSDYVEVHDRIAEFYERFPEGSLTGSYVVRDIDGQTLIVYHAKAHRSPDDKHPGDGFASEPFPGHTPYTKGSELMNAETSAWGRAIAATGIAVKRGIASANEVRSAEARAPRKVLAMSKKQRDFLERLLKENLDDDQNVLLILDWAQQVLIGGKGGSASEAIDGLKEKPDETAARLLTAAQTWQAKQTEIPFEE
jgi:hypothetical protein